MKRLKKSGAYLHSTLHDDASPYGGTAFQGETLKDFLLDVLDVQEDLTDYSMKEVNRMLKSCGIRPIRTRKMKGVRR